MEDVSLRSLHAVGLYLIFIVSNRMSRRPKGDSTTTLSCLHWTLSIRPMKNQARETRPKGEVVVGDGLQGRENLERPSQKSLVQRFLPDKSSMISCGWKASQCFSILLMMGSPSNNHSFTSPRAKWSLRIYPVLTLPLSRLEGEAEGDLTVAKVSAIFPSFPSGGGNS